MMQFSASGPPRCYAMLMRFACLLAAFGASTAASQSAAKPAAASEKLVSVPGLGPLMLTPIQRQNLEFLRNSGGNSTRFGIETDELLDPRAGLPETLTISGIVTRSSGRSTVWINNEPLYGKGGGSAIRTLASQAGVFKPGAGEMQIRIKPGTLVDVPTRQTTDVLPPGAIRIIPPRTNSTPDKKGVR